MDLLLRLHLVVVVPLLYAIAFNSHGSFLFQLDTSSVNSSAR